MRTLRCPLCAETFVCQSEAECEAHIASCNAFHERYADRAGLVSGMGEAVSATASASAAPPPSGVAPLSMSCDALAAILLPMIPAAKEDKSVEETVEMVVQLVAALLSAEQGAEFGLEELLTVTLDPYLMQLSNGRELRRAIPQALDAVRRAPSESAAARCEALQASLTRLTCTSSTSASDEAPAPMPPLAVGAHVRLQTLVARPELNGCSGRVIAWKAEKGRCVVKLDGSGDTLLLRPPNLRLVEDEVDGIGNPWT